MRRSVPNAPFKPPRLLSSGSSAASANNPSSTSTKEVGYVGVSRSNGPGARVASQPGTNPKRPKLAGISNTVLQSSASEKPLLMSLSSKYYVVQWRKYTNKKNKSWDGDGYIAVSSSGITLKGDTHGNGNHKLMGKTSNTNIDGLIKFGSYEAEVDYEITSKDELVSLQSTQPASSSSRTSSLSENDSIIPVSQTAARPYKKLQTSLTSRLSPSTSPALTESRKRAPLYETTSEDAFVLPPPPDSSNYVDVVVDPLISKHLRPHQREGIIFLYECLSGFRNYKGNGALLCDEMSLGKTLMTISLIWTLLKQNPDPVSKSPMIKKVLIACPVTLIDNWRKEFKKWLDLNRIGILALNNKPGSSTSKDKQDIISFGKTKVYQVLIMSYEKILTCQDELKTVPFDLLICDEGHRLKNSTNKVIKAFNTNIKIDRKILLTGTPIQNDLVEFYNIINFVNPNILGSFQSFQKNFINPIERSRDINCKNKDTIKRGEDASEQLISLTKNFMLRRTASSISNYLPNKTDLILFCPPTDLQLKLFNYIIKTKNFNALINEVNSNPNNSLSLITLFKKICNSPSLIENDKLFRNLIEADDERQSLNIDIGKLKSNFTSSKINLLIPLLIEFKSLNLKTVLVSNYTQTLDLLQSVIQKLNITFSRLDGSTPNKVRDSLVSTFNKSPDISVFLLSAKSGGVGLNLIGASRLVLFDNDWNPSVDLQAMARIHRDGQTKPVFIYRIFTTGCIDEKILQRQLMKNNLSDKFLDGKTDSKLNSFDIVDLKDLFTVNDSTTSNTHDLLECQCNGDGNNLQDIILDSDSEELDVEDNPSGWISALDYKQVDEEPKRKKLSIRNALAEYQHFDPKSLNRARTIKTGDDVIDKILQNKNTAPISFLLTKFSSGKPTEIES